MACAPGTHASTCASGLHGMDRFFRDLSENQLILGVFRNVADLEWAIADYVEQNNDDPKPFIWTAKTSDILEKIKRASSTLNMLPTV